MAPLTELPSWVSKLQSLVPVVGTLTTVATNPQEWLRGFVFNLVAEWIVRTFLDALEYGLGWVTFAYGRTISIVLDAVPILRSPFRAIEGAAVGLVETIFGAATTVATTAGLAGPPATAFAVLLLLTVALAVGYATFSVIPGSDAVQSGLEVFRG